MREWLAYFSSSRTNRVATFPSLYPCASVLFFPGWSSQNDVIEPQAGCDVNLKKTRDGVTRFCIRLLPSFVGRG